MIELNRTPLTKCKLCNMDVNMCLCQLIDTVLARFTFWNCSGFKVIYHPWIWCFPSLLNSCVHLSVIITIHHIDKGKGFTVTAGQCML